MAHEFPTHDADNCQRMTVYRHPGDFPAEVRSLFDAAERTSFEFGHKWYRNLLDAVYPGSDAPSFYVLWVDKVPIAALPLLVTRKWNGRYVESLTNFYSALYAPVLSESARAEHLLPLLRAIRRDHAPLASLRFAPMDPGTRSHQLLRQALELDGLKVFDFFCFGNWYLTGFSDWAKYLASRGGTLRSTIKRMGKKFGADGGTIEIVQSGPRLDPALQAYETVYANSWKLPEPYPQFVPGLIAACAEQNWLRLGVAWINNEPIAAQLWIVAGGRASIYKVAYDERFKAYAPGTLLTSHLMEHVLTVDNVSEVDYMIGDDKYKKTWMSDRRERRGLIAYNARSVAGVFGYCKELIGRAIRRVQRIL